MNVIIEAEQCLPYIKFGDRVVGQTLVGRYWPLNPFEAVKSPSDFSKSFPDTDVTAWGEELRDTDGVLAFRTVEGTEG